MVMIAHAWKAYDSVNNIIHCGRMFLRYWGPRLQPANSIGIYLTKSVITHLLLDGWCPHISYKKTIGFIYRILRRICRLCANLCCLSDCFVFALVSNITALFSALFTNRIGRLQSRASISKELTILNICN
jgi:hypothetical protein